MAQVLPDNPFLKGAFAPIQMECDAPDLVIEGEIPRDLNGSFYRNGPNVQFAPRGDYHLFAGDGMIHAFHIGDGRVSYRNRWVRTAKFKLERELGRSVINPLNPFDCEEGYTDFVLTDKEGLANTACIWHGGRLLAMEEGHFPFELDPITLDSIGSHNFGGRLTSAMTAHPKLDPKTGELVFFAYMASGPFSADIGLFKVSRDGVLTESHMLQAPYPSMVHDFAVTENFVVFPLFPLTGSLDRAMQGKPPFAWEADKPSYLGIMPRNGSAEDVRWIEADTTFAFHVMNGFDSNGVITIDLCQFAYAPLFPDPDGNFTKDASSHLSRWTIDVNGAENRPRMNRIDEYESEFPQLDPRHAMRDYRYGFYTSPDGEGGQMFNAVGRYDHHTQSVERYSFGPRTHVLTSEAIFVPRSEQSPEGQGYLLAVVTDMTKNTSCLQVLDAENISAGPLGTAHLSHRVPIGFHGTWRAA
jgi:carotenoid cleavage dioxygenase